MKENPEVFPKTTSEKNIRTKLFKFKYFETLNPVNLFLFNSYFSTPITSVILESWNWPTNIEPIVKNRMPRLKFFSRDKEECLPMDDPPGPQHTMQAVEAAATDASKEARNYETLS